MAQNAEAPMSCGDIRDLSLADQGKRRTEWAFQSMPVLQSIRKQFIKTQPLAGIRIAACLPVTPETANLMITLRDGGAAASLCAPDARSTEDEVAATLVRDYHIPVFAIRDAPSEIAAAHVQSALDSQPHITMDAGMELLNTVHTRRPELLDNIAGGIEETATGAVRLRAMARQGTLRYPVMAINDSSTKRLYDNRLGTGQSVIDAILRSVNILLAGCHFVVAGFGWCGRGIAWRARGMGAAVIVTEVDPIRAIEAAMDGFRVMSMAEAAAIGEVFVTATGGRSVITRDHVERMKNGAVLCNAGNPGMEIDLDALSKLVSAQRPVRDHAEEYALRDGRRVYVLGGGRPINFLAAEGHPATVMDVNFANQALAVEHLVKHTETLESRVYPVPAELDRRVARIKLESMGVKIDRLTLEQEQYLANSPDGT